MQVVASTDVVLEVLDARDPEACRSQEIEQKVLSFGDKKLVLVLNKVDLVPQQVAVAWYNYLST